ncbi:MAG: AI-2E family transporter [Deltaproteobacteria bacterium]|nr:AI-2E family transporter [Nannocystaceae bacterium]
MRASIKSASVPGLQRFVSIATVALIVGVLWVAQTVLMPLAFGMVLAFLLTPVVRWFERLRFPRALAVAGTMTVALAAVGVFGWVVMLQVGELSGEIGQYASSLEHKLAEVRRHPGGTIDRLEQTVETVSAELDDSDSDSDATRARPVRVVPEHVSGLTTLRENFEPVLAPLAALVLVLVLVSFMLGRREDVRDRVIRLLGPDNVTTTTRLIDDAFSAVSRFLFVQTLLNTTVGVLVTLGLWWIGVPYAALWGALTAVLRFVPYLGTLVAMALPAVVAFATTPGLDATLATIGVFALLDVSFGYFIEPLVIGRHGGVSSLALLVSAVFWTWIWGPVGLAVATPLTLCIAVLGRQMPQLEWLGVLLGDAPPRAGEVSEKQRVRGRDRDEAQALNPREREVIGETRVMDEILIPALCWLVRDQQRAEISDDDAKFVGESTKVILAMLEPAAPVAGEMRWVAIAARPCGDPLLQMLRVCGATAELPSSNLLSAELLDELARDPPAMVCITALSSSGSTHARRLCRRIRTRLPEIELLVLRPAADRRASEPSDDGGFERRALESGADAVVGTIADTLAYASDARARH